MLSRAKVYAAMGRDEDCLADLELLLRRTSEQASYATRPHPIRTYPWLMKGFLLQDRGDTDAALQVFEQLQQRDPPHVPSFFMAAQMLADDEQVEAARALLREGIEIARSQGDSHAAGEMGDLLMMLGSAQ